MKKAALMLMTGVMLIAGLLWPVPSWLQSSPPDLPLGPARPAPAHQARHWQRLEDTRVHCQLCPHACVIPDGGRGLCRVRENRQGTLWALTYGKPVALGVSPIEKAPFHHFRPGHLRQTLATVGCNLRCKHCQNWSLSQRSVEEVRYRSLSPQEVVTKVKRAGLTSISFTYTEPTVFFEYVYDISKLAQAQGLKTTLVTNGYISPEPLRALLKHTDAVRVDLKAFTEEFYREISGASLEPVLRTLKIIQEEGVWLEIIHLVIPTLNDHPEETRAMGEWIVKNLGPNVPLHVNRFHPSFQMTHLPPTPVETLERVRAVAKETGLRFVTIGNVPGHRYDNTFCPACGEIVIRRVGMAVMANHIKAGGCGFCGEKIPGVWE